MISAFPLWWAALAACGDKAATDTSAADDTGGEERALSLIEDDVPRDGDLWTDATWTGTVTSDGVGATIAYTEWWDSEPPHCTAEMSVSGTALSGDCEGACADADWAWSITAAVTASDGACTWRQPDNAPGLSGGQYDHYIAHFTDVDSAFGPMAEMLTLGYYSAQGSSATYLYMDDGESAEAMGWDPSGALSYASSVGTGQPRLWRVCGASEEVGVDEAFLGSEPQSGTTGQDLSDVWTIDGSAGQVLNAGVDVTDGASPRLALVDPDGCLVGEAFLNAACSSGELNCPSLSWGLPTGGVWTLVVSNLAGAPMDYTLSAALE